MSPILAIRIITPSLPHSLRALSVVSFFPAFILLLISGIISGRVNPAIALLPLFFSAVYSASLLANERQCGCDAAGLTGTPLHMLCDMLCGMPLLVCLILGWVSMGSWAYDAGAVVVGTYGTMFLLFNIGVHAYFVAKQVQDALTPGAKYPSACAQCQHMAFPQISFKFAGERRDGYDQLLDGEGRPAAPEEGEDAV